jgi:hypothetical protein
MIIFLKHERMARLFHVKAGAIFLFKNSNIIVEKKVYEYTHSFNLLFWRVEHGPLIPASWLLERLELRGGYLASRSRTK